LIEDFLRGRASSGKLLALAHDCYPALVDSHESFSLTEAALRSSLEELSQISLTSSPAHVLGDAFQALMGPRLRGDKGQFFTPRSLVRCMVQVVDPKPFETVIDPACGTGGFLMETHAHWLNQGLTASARTLVGVDKDHDLYRLSSALLAIACGDTAYVSNGNSLDFNAWVSPLPQLGSADVVLTNPPFGAKIGITDPDLLRSYSFGHQWVRNEIGNNWLQAPTLAADQDPQILFLELCIHLLKPGGRLGIVLPEGIFGNKQTRFIWEWLDERGRITSLLDCPRTTFQPGTDTKTNVLFFEKKQDHASEPTGNETIRIGVALECGHDRRGRSTRADGNPYPDDFRKLGPSYHKSSSSLWSTATPKNRDYLVPRYFAPPAPLTAVEATIVDGAEWVSIETALNRDWITIRKGHEVGSEAYGTGDIPFVRTSDISNLEISSDPTKSVGEEVYEQYARQQALCPGSILMVVDGRYRIGATAMLTPNNVKCVVQSHLRIVTVGKNAPFDPYSLLYALNLASVRLHIRNLVFNQSTLGTHGSRLRELRIPVLSVQGPWENRMRQFRAALVERDRLAGEIRTMMGPEFEL
jgi:type I restriction enzyme M protein